MILEHVLVLSAYLFSIGIYGLITSRNMVRALMCLELILNAVNINFVTFTHIFTISMLFVSSLVFRLLSDVTSIQSGGLTLVFFVRQV